MPCVGFARAALSQAIAAGKRAIGF
jgi:hypothetical protein